MFQELHKMKDSSVASRISGHMRSVIVDHLRHYFIGKSCRCAAMTKLAWDPSVTFDEAVALGGWTTNANRDWCVWTCLVALIPSVASLSRHPDCRIIPHPPTLGMLFHHSDLLPSQRFITFTHQEFVKRLCVTNIPEFKIANTPQRMLLVSVTAVMVMHFDHCHQKCGGTHRHCTKMIDFHSLPPQC